MAESEASQGYIHSFESAGCVDGPGIRFVIFTSGCPLRCAYCHNPDTWDMKSGELMSSDDVVARFSKMATFYQSTGGGITISGGEPLMQPSFILEILQKAKALGLSTALDTSGALFPHINHEVMQDIIQNTDLFLLDIKEFDGARYKNLTGGELDATLDFARFLSKQKKPIWLRYVLVPGLTDNLESINALAKFASQLGNVEKVEVIPFHKLGEFKWQNLGLPYTLAKTRTPKTSEVENVRAIFSAHNLST